MAENENNETTEQTLSTPKTYFRVDVRQVPRDLESAVTQLSFAMGALGVAEKLSFYQPDLTFDARIRKVPHLHLEIFFTTRPEGEYFTKLKGLSSLIDAQVAEEEEKDWLEEWKKNFKPFRFVRDIWVVPHWLPAPAEARRVIKIDPGMAFGTGTHATTQMAAELLHARLNGPTRGDNPLINFLDVGTGTAILAVLAHLQGVTNIRALEIDPEARRKARENVILNNCNGQILIEDHLLEEEKRSYDLICANIIDGVLIHLNHDLRRILARDGRLIVSGILLEREELFLEKFISQLGWRVERRLEMDEWVAFELSNPTK